MGGGAMGWIHTNLYRNIHVPGCKIVLETFPARRKEFPDLVTIWPDGMSWCVDNIFYNSRWGMYRMMKTRVVPKNVLPEEMQGWNLEEHEKGLENEHPVTITSRLKAVAKHEQTNVSRT